MNGVPGTLLVLLAAAAILLSALLTAGETAVLRLGRTRAQPGEPADGSPADPRETAAAAAGVGVVLEAVAAVSLTLVLAALELSWWQVVVAALVLLGAAALLVVRFVPRAVARRSPEGVLRVTSPLLAAARVLVRPLRRVVVPVPDPPSDEEIRRLMDRASEADVIEDDERRMFRSVLELGDTLTRAVMVPRTEMVTLPAGTPLRKALSLFLRSGYSRVPVVGATVDDPLGVLYLKDVVRHLHAAPDAADAPAEGLVRPAVFVPESKPVDDLLREMQRGASHIAIVVDEYGGIAGLVTIEDALEEIVGELTDEHDRSGPEVEDLGDGGFRVPARLPLDELGDLFGAEIDDDDVETAGGLLAKALGKVPLAGSSAVAHGLVLTADRVEGRRKQVATLVVRRAESNDQDAVAAAGGARG